MLTHELIEAREPQSKRLTIALHGLGDSMEGYRWLPDAMRLPDMNYLLVNAPDSYYGGYSWYDIQGDAAPGVVRSRGMLFELYEHLEGRGFPPEQTVLFGFSQGSLMILDSGLRHGKAFAGLIGVSGYLFDPERLPDEWSEHATRTPVLMTHGRRDPLIPIEGVRRQVEAVKAAGLSVEWREFEKDHTIAGREEVDCFREFIRRCYGK